MEVIYFLICFFQPIFLPIPEAVTIMSASEILGPFKAFIIAFLGTVIGIIVMYSIARIAGEKYVKKFIKSNQIIKYSNYVKKNEILITGLLFIFPVLPDEIVCVGAGITGISFEIFVLIAVLSKLITSLTFAYSLQIANILAISKFQLIFIELVILLIFTIVSQRKRSKGSKIV